MPTRRNLGPKTRHPLMLLRRVAPRTQLSNWHVSRFAYLSLLPGPQQHVITGSNWWKTTCFTSLVVCENTFLLYLRRFTWWQLILILGGKLIDMNDGCNLDLDWIICFETNWERNHILNELSPPFSFIFSWNFWPPLCFPFIPIHWTLPVSLCTICRWRRPWGYLRWCCCCCHRRRWWWSQALLPAAFPAFLVTQPSSSRRCKKA